MAQNDLSLNEIANSLLNALRGGRSSNSEHISLQQIKFMIKYYRALFIRRDAQRNMHRLRMFEQDLGLLTLTNQDTAEDATANSNLVVKRSVELPEPIRLKNSEGFTHISYPDQFGEQIPLNDASRAPWNFYGKYTSEAPFVSYLNGRLYLFNDEINTQIRVRGVFADPEEVHNFTRANGLDLYSDDSAFPCPHDMVEAITKGILDGELKIIAQTQTDNELNTLQE